MNGSSLTCRDLVMDFAPRPIRSEDDYWAARQQFDLPHELFFTEKDAAV